MLCVDLPVFAGAQLLNELRCIVLNCCYESLLLLYESLLLYPLAASALVGVMMHLFSFQCRDARLLAMARCKQ